MLRVVKFCLILSLICVLFASTNYAKPPPGVVTTTESMTTHHIVSYVEQQKLKANKHKIKEFDFETFDQSNDTPKKSEALMLEDPPNYAQTDDLQNLDKNTLENANSEAGEQHESKKILNSTKHSNGDVAWQRDKKGIPVLQPIKDLLNHINNGEGNHTVHRTLLADGYNQNTTTESAIETNKDREMINHSNELGFLEFFGQLGVSLWEFVANIFKFLTGASGAIFSSSSG